MRKVVTAKYEPKSSKADPYQEKSNHWQAEAKKFRAAYDWYLALVAARRNCTSPQQRAWISKYIHDAYSEAEQRAKVIVGLDYRKNLESADMR
jgi:hypothetical protein